MYSISSTSNKVNTFFKSYTVNQINQNESSRTSAELQKMKALLNSQRIALIFNNCGVEILRQDKNLRVSNLNSNGVMRTCAIATFSLPVPAWYKDTHDKIYNGGSIGQTIKDSGFELTKKDVYFGVTQLPQIAKSKMGVDAKLAAVHIYELTVKNPHTLEVIDYCTITEIHSPLYLTLEDLRQLSTFETIEKHSAITEPVQRHLDDLSNLDEWLSYSSINNNPT